MSRLELEDFVYMYPDMNDENIQEIISGKEEFREVEGLISESVPKRGGLFRHQIFFKRLMRQYDNQFVIWQTGVGKACGYITIVEYYKHIADELEEIRKNSLNEKAFQPAYKRAYILVKGKNLINETKNQILCKCTDGDYITKQILNSKTDKALKGNISRSIGNFYEIMTYGDFAKKTFAMSDDQMKEQYENCIFIVDEVHNINDDIDGGKLKKDEKTGNNYYSKKIKNKKTQQIEEKIVEHRLIYDQIWRVLHSVKRRKAIILSATPMINGPEDLASRINLILPENLQMPANIDWDTITLQDLKPYFNGRISYVRSLDTGAIPVYQGDLMNFTYNINDKIVDSQYIIYGKHMQGKQLKVYDVAEKDPQLLRPESLKPEAFNDLKRQVSNFVFPNEKTGENGFNEFIVENNNKFSANKKLIPYLTNLNSLKDLSIKFSEIVRLCKTDPGNCWCYIEYIKGSGAILLSLCFQYNGFEIYTETSSVFGLSANSKTGRNICASGSAESKNRSIRISRKPRIALLTSENEKQQQSIIELFNSYENRNGDYIKVVVGSPQSRDGLNLSNVLQIHLTGPGWNQASSYQAESRAIRSTSHVDLIEDERKRLSDLGLDPNTASVEIKIYRHAALDNDGGGVDVERYILSEEKDISIKRILRMMKQCSVDCQINYKKNVRVTDIDGSAACDYDECQYTCINPKPLNIDYTSLNVLYIKDIIDKYIEQIINIFRFVFRITKEDIYIEIIENDNNGDNNGDNNKKIIEKYIDLAIADLIENKKEIINRYGYKSYLIEDRNILFLSNDYPLKHNNIDISSYSQLLILNNTKTLDTYNTILQQQMGVQDINIENLTIENKILILEDAIDKFYYNDKVDDNEELDKSDKVEELQEILETFQKNFFKVSVPVSALEYVKLKLTNRGKGRGRKPKKDTKFKLKAAELKELENIINTQNTQNTQVNSSSIFIHNLTSEKISKTSYSTNVEYKYLFDKIRIREKLWRDADESEEIVYNKIISMQRISTMQNNKIYAKIDKLGRFSIVRGGSLEDHRKYRRGLACSSMKVVDLIDLAWELQFFPFKNLESFSREEMLQTITSLDKLKDVPNIENFSDDKLKYFYDWFTSHATKIVICEKLRAFFEEQKLVKYI